jgi:hypothetical protein
MSLLPQHKAAFVLRITPDGAAAQLPPRTATGLLRTPLSVQWTLQRADLDESGMSTV